MIQLPNETGTVSASIYKFDYNIKSFLDNDIQSRKNPIRLV